MKSATLAMLSVLAIAGCSGGGHESRNAEATQKNSAADVKMPTIDIGTPDKAIATYWGVVDAARKQAQITADHNFSDFRKEQDAMLSKVMTSGALPKPNGSAFETFARDITSVNVETETRAVIIARIRNTTPLPAGAALGDYEMKARGTGDQYKYVLEKDSAGWKVAEIWVFEPIIKHDWEKEVPRDTAPYIPTLTMDGR